jgi:YVTN family beta-propeller protein
MSPVLSGDGTLLYVCNRFDGNVSVVDTASGAEITKVDVPRQPVAAAISLDSSYLFVANLLATGALSPGNTSAVVSVIDTSTRTIIAEISLPNGSVAPRGICLSADGRYAYVTHQLSRYQMPMLQADRGWIMTNAVSVIDVSTKQYVNTFLLDEVYKGAGNPWACVCTTTDPNKLCVTGAGTHELSVIDRNGLHYRLSNLPYPGGFSDEAADVPHDLGFLSGLRERIPLPGKGPRAIAVFGRKAYIAEYFSDTISIVDIDTEDANQVPLGPQNSPDLARKGERLFHDSTTSYQGWLSCSSCHPDARPDGLNWDFSPGTPRNTRSHLYSPMTPPTNIEGNCATAYDEILGGFPGDLFVHNPIATADSNAIHEFMLSLKPVQSPHLVNGQLSADAQNGKSIFEARCSSCHSGDYYTDISMHDVGTGYGGGEPFDTPTLAEVWRTGPYLQDGRAATMLEVLTTYNPSNQHGVTSDLTGQQQNELSEYVLSLGAICIGDFDKDGEVGPDDLKILAAAWLSVSGGPNWNHICDISDPNDLKINGLDFGVFYENWQCP